MGAGQFKNYNPPDRLEPWHETHNVLLQVAIAYLELVRAKAELTIAEETLANASELARVTDEFAKAGEGLQSDA